MRRPGARSARPDECRFDNQDGLQDILVSNCNEVHFLPTPFELFRNNGDLTFTDVAQEVGLTGLGFWMSVSFGDIDNDGDLDLFASNNGTAHLFGVKSPHALYLNNGGTYEFFSEQGGVDNLEWGWGSTLADYDNDGDLDLYFAGSLPPPPFGVIGPGLANPGRLFENDGTGRFTFVSVPRSTPSSCSASRMRRKRPPACTTRTLCPSTPWAASAASTSTPCSSSRAGR